MGAAEERDFNLLQEAGAQPAGCGTVRERGNAEARGIPSPRAGGRDGKPGTKQTQSADEPRLLPGVQNA